MKHISLNLLACFVIALILSPCALLAQPPQEPESSTVTEEGTKGAESTKNDEQGNTKSAEASAGTNVDEPSSTTTTSSPKQKATESSAKSKTAKPKQGQTKALPPANDGEYDLSFDNLKFEMEKGDTFKRSMLTEKIKNYDGATVTLRGYIRPSFSQSGLKKFIFVRDNKECCFGPGAALYDCVLVTLAKGKETDYTVRPITIEGKFVVKEYERHGQVWAIYRMGDVKVK